MPSPEENLLFDVERMLRDTNGQPQYYDRHGEPLTGVLAWAEWMEDEENKRVALDSFYGTDISTVCLGLDHNWGEGPPIIFETMVFSHDSFYDGLTRRYSTEAQARKGHVRTVWYVARWHWLAATLSIAAVLVALVVMARA